MNLPPEIFRAHTRPMLSHINVGSGTEISIAELARLVARTVGYAGRIVLDASKPDGTPRKLMDSSRLAALGWRPEIEMTVGLTTTYRDFQRGAHTIA